MVDDEGQTTQDNLSELLLKIQLDEVLQSHEVKHKYPRTPEKFQAELYQIFSVVGLKTEDIHMVHALCARFVSRDKILSFLRIWFEADVGRYRKVYRFFNDFTVQRRLDAIPHVKFSVERIPDTKPEWDIMFWAMTAPLPDLKKENVYARPTAVRIRWDPEMQSMAKEGNAIYWANKHGHASPSRMARSALWTETLYSLGSMDQFPLMLPDGSSTRFKAFDSGAPYTSEDLDEWFRLIRKERGLLTEKSGEEVYFDTVLI